MFFGLHLIQNATIHHRPLYSSKNPVSKNFFFFFRNRIARQKQLRIKTDEYVSKIKYDIFNHDFSFPLSCLYCYGLSLSLQCFI